MCDKKTDDATASQVTLLHIAMICSHIAAPALLLLILVLQWCIFMQPRPSTCFQEEKPPPEYYTGDFNV